MAVDTSKTYDFNPYGRELILEALARIGVRPTEITQQHMYHARMSANMVLSEWSNTQPNLWEVGLQQVPLIQGFATYSMPAETVTILDAYITYNLGTDSTLTTDRYIQPISRTEYASYPNKSQQGFPTVYWFDRTISPQVTLWMVPDGNGPYILKYYSVRQTQDFKNENTAEVPYRFLDAFVSALAWRLSQKFAPALEPRLQALAERAWALASTQDVENNNIYIVPGISGYYNW